MKKLILVLLVALNVAFADDMALLQSECSNKNASSCSDLAFKYYEKQDYQKAAEFYKKACDDGFAGGCYNLGSLYDEGKGMKQDFSKAVEFYSKACDGVDVEGCYNLGILYGHGQGVR